MKEWRCTSIHIILCFIWISDIWISSKLLFLRR